MNKETPLPTTSERSPRPPRYRLLECGEPTPLIPPESNLITETALLPTGRYAVVGNSDIHVVTMSLQAEPRIANGRDWMRPTVEQKSKASYMHFGIRCVSDVARMQIENVLRTRIIVERDGETLVGVPSASYAVLRPGRPNVQVVEWPIDMFYNPDTDCQDKPNLLTLPSHVDEMKGWSFQVTQEQPV